MKMALASVDEFKPVLFIAMGQRPICSGYSKKLRSIPVMTTVHSDQIGLHGMPLKQITFSSINAIALRNGLYMAVASKMEQNLIERVLIR